MQLINPFRPNNPTQAAEFFKEKITFTTGPAELQDAIERHEDINIIDVRQAEDYDEGHIPGAINLPKTDWSSFKGLSKDKLNVVYCYSAVCHLAASACLEFAQKGFPVLELEGGIAEWKEYEYPLERKAENKTFESPQVDATANLTRGMH